MDKIIAFAGLAIIFFWNSLFANADSSAFGKMTNFGLRYGKYTFANRDNEKAYGNHTEEISFDYTFDSPTAKIFHGELGLMEWIVQAALLPATFL